MKCQICSNEATVHLTEIINGNLTEIHLCEEHAKEKGTDFPNPFSSTDLFSSFFEVLNDPSVASKGTHTVCPSCGTSYLDFSKLGRLGCADCYESFKNGLIPLIKRVQRSLIHQGKRPGQTAAKGRGQTVLQKLQKQLQTAIETEDYETAARLRDEIKKTVLKKK